MQWPCVHTYNQDHGQCNNIHAEIHEHPWLAVPKDNVLKYIHSDQNNFILEDPIECAPV